MNVVGTVDACAEAMRSESSFGKWRYKVSKQAENAEARFLSLLRYAALVIAALADVANARLTQARNEADEQTARNHARKMDGHQNVGMGGMLFLGFMAVMFLYLFVAMERHHRNLRALIATCEG